MNTKNTYETSQQARNAGFLPLLRAMVRVNQAFCHTDAKLLEQYDLTQSQADVLFTLGNTDGMTFKDIGGRTLISKGTLTGVINRMVGKGLVHVCAAPDDARSRLVTLTPAGNALFQRAFPEHISRIEVACDALSPSQQSIVTAALNDLTAAFRSLNS